MVKSNRIIQDMERKVGKRITVIKTDKMVINLDNVVTIKKHTKYPKSDSIYDDDVEYLIGISTITQEWITIFRYTNEDDRDNKFNELLSQI